MPIPQTHNQKANKLINDMCVISYRKYINDDYKIVIEYYGELYVNIWTTFDWLSGKHFLTNQHNNNNEINKLKETKIKVKIVTMTLSKAYYLILPLNSNLNTLFNFHNIILFYLEEEFNNYVNMQAMIIMMYLKYMQTPIENTIIHRLGKSLKWYKKVKKPFL